MMYKGIKHKFDNGEEYTIPPVSIGSLDILEEEYGKMATWGVGTDRRLMSETVYAALKRNYPDLKEEKFKTELIDIGNMVELMSYAMDSGAAIRKRVEAGETKPGKK